ncbi:MAG: smc 2 [Chthonomonadales bacterium]|nr:smc 2 [Chthonomonadales bacterium]
MLPRDYRNARIVWLSASASLCIVFAGPASGASEKVKMQADTRSLWQSVANLALAVDLTYLQPTQDDAVDPTAQLTALQAALVPPTPALAPAGKARDTAMAIVSALPTGAPSLSADSIDAIRKAQQTLANKTLIPDAASLTALSARLQKDLDDTDADGLTKQRADLSAAVTTASKINPGNIADTEVRKTFSDTRTKAVGVLAQMDAILNDIKTKILPAATPSLIDRIQGVNDYAGQLIVLMQKAYASSGITDLAADAKPDAVRAALASGQRGLLAVEPIRIALLPVWKGTYSALTTLTNLSKNDVQEALDTMTKSVVDSDTGVFGHLAPWLDALRKAEADEITSLHTRTADLGQTLSAPERNTTIVTNAAATRDEATQHVYDLNNITAAMPALFTFWEANDLKPGVSAAEKSFSALRQTADQLSIQAGVLDSLLSGDADHFVQDQVRLFYFTDVPRVIQAINPKAKLVTDARTEAAAQRKNNANTDLINEEKQIAALNEETARHQDRVRALQESIRQANAQLADAKNRQAQAQARQKALDRQANATANQTTDLTAQKTALKAENGILDTQIMAIDEQLKDPAVISDTVKTNDLKDQKLQKQQRKEANNAQIDNIDLQAAALQTKTVAQTDAKSAATDYGTAVTTIQGQIAQFNDQLAQLTPQLSAAKQDLIDAQVRRAAARQESAILAQAETEAFGEARDNQPFWYAPSEGILSNDPAHRVILFGDPDSSVINIRGLPRDVERVKEIIATFDRPAPQSRITLYSLQINGASTKRLNDALKSVDDILRDMRGAIVLVQDKFRDSINREVELAAKETSNEFTTARPEDRARLKRYTYYAPEISQALGFPDVKGSTTDIDYAAIAHLTRWTLPDPANSTTLGEAMFVFSLGRYDARLRMLGRFVAQIYGEYILADKNRGPDNRHPMYGHLEGTRRFLYALRPILEDPHSPGKVNPVFVSALSKDNPTLCTLESFLANYKDIPNPDPKGPPGGYPHFFVTILGSVADSMKSNTNPPEMTPNQLEILKALQTKSREAVSAEVNYLLREIGRLPVGERFGENTVGDMYREQCYPLIGWLYSKFAAPYKPSETNSGNGAAASGKSTQPDEQSKYSWREQGLKALHLDESKSDTTQSAPTKPKSAAPKDTNPSAQTAAARYLKADLHAHSIAHLVQERAALSQATARVAAADDMIKRMIIVVEDDLDYFFISPALEKLRRQVTAQGVELGTLQRESILATNRLIARVDPRATAIANLPAGTDVLNQAQQLGQIAAQFRESQRSAKLNTTLPLAGAGVNALAQGHAGTALAYGGLLSLLGDLATQPQGPQGELFSINTGSKFQIRPIFDPSGQAMRFKFDYVAQTLIQAPDGSVTPDPSRIDRHTVNTEVQLTNLEVREISRFESNARLGTPTVQTGGFPIINQIPILRDIPILGYFYRRNASAATRQESIIFAQTSLYPTIGDIMNLLTDIPLRSELDTSTPRYLQGEPLLALSDLVQEPASTSGVVKATVKLNYPAPTGGAKIGLTSSDSDKTQLWAKEDSTISITSLVVPPGEQTATFYISSTASDKGNVSITASYGDVPKTVKLLNNAPPVPPAPKADLNPSLTFDDPAPFGGSDVTGSVTFSKTPEKDGTITLQSNSSALYFDSNSLSFTVEQIKAMPKVTFKAHTQPVSSKTPIVVSADAGGKGAVGAVLLNAPALKAFYLAYDPQQKQYQAILTLDAPAAADMPVNLTSKSTYVILPKDRKFVKGQQALTIPITMKSVKSRQEITITAKIGDGETKSTTLTLVPTASDPPSSRPYHGHK